uniref:Tripartite motif containing 25 n=1 Tax=Petromyzon marinus TaxID=7757 RepID=S4R8W2_PETMA
MASRLKQLGEELTCVVCMEEFAEPVTLGCGHNFCQGCIERCWEAEEGAGAPPSCPQCRRRFAARPLLQKNTVLANVVKQLSLRDCLDDEPLPMLHHNQQQQKPQQQQQCALCLPQMRAAVKSCFTCDLSFCAEHSLPHSTAAYGHHKVVEPAVNVAARKCSEHGERLRYVCREDGALVCVDCTTVGAHRNHAAVRVEREDPVLKVRRRESITLMYAELTPATAQASDVTAAHIRRSLKCKMVQVHGMFILKSSVVKQLDGSAVERERQLSKRCTQPTVYDCLYFQKALMDKLNALQRKMKAVRDNKLEFSARDRDMKSALAQGAFTKMVKIPVADVATKLLQGVIEGVDGSRSGIADLGRKRSTRVLNHRGGGEKGHSSHSPLQPPQIPHFLTLEDTKCHGLDFPLQPINQGPHHSSASIPPLASNAYPGSTLKSHYHPQDLAHRPSPSESKFVQLVLVIISHFLTRSTRSDRQSYKRNLVMDISTAHPNLLISKDCHMATYSEEAQDYPDNAQRFECVLQVLCTESFSSGQHYWEVYVKCGTQWEVGVAYGSIGRKRHNERNVLGNNSVSWCFSLANGEFSGWHNGNKAVVDVRQPLEVLGVHLDYEAGTVTFYNAQSMALLHSFTGSFAQPLYPAFGVYPASSLALCDF